MSASRRSPRPSASSRARSSVKLFEKEGRGIRITRYGEVFLRHAGASVAAIQQGIDSVSRAQTNSGPPLRIGALPTVSARIMPKAIQLFLAEETGSPVKIVTGENVVLLEQLRVGVLDLVVGRLAAPEQMTGLSFEHLYSEQVVLRGPRATIRCSRPRASTSRRLREFTDPDADARLDHPAVRRALPAVARHRRAAGRDRDGVGLVRPRPRCGSRTRSGSSPRASSRAISRTARWRRCRSTRARPRARWG